MGGGVDRTGHSRLYYPFWQVWPEPYHGAANRLIEDKSSYQRYWILLKAR